jgi:hypothetical protein
MSRSLFLVKIQADEKCFSVAGARAIISPKGLFAWDVRLPAGTPVVVQLCDGPLQLTLFGTVSTSDADLGVAIEFKETTESMSRRLVSLLVAQHS